MPQKIFVQQLRNNIQFVIINFDLYKGSSSVCGPVKLTDLTKNQKSVVVKMTHTQGHGVMYAGKKLDW